MEIVNVKEVIGSKLATSSDKGLLLYKILVEKVSNKEPVTVDFSDIKTVIPSFTNKAFGKLFDVINLTEQYKAEMNKMYQEIEEQNA